MTTGDCRKCQSTADKVYKTEQSGGGFKPAAVSVSLRRAKLPPFDEYPFCVPAVRTLQEIDLHQKVAFFVGENGWGKSTLLEAIAVSLGFNAERGSKNFRFDTRRSHSVSNEYLRIAKGVKRPRSGFFLRADSFFCGYGDRASR